MMLEALLTALTFVWFAYSAWKHRHEPVWQIGTLLIVTSIYGMAVPGWLRDFTVTA